MSAKGRSRARISPEARSAKGSPARRALVTGGSGAIGAAICRELAASGHRVFVHGHRNVDAARTVAASIVAAGGVADTVLFDITDTKAVAARLGPLVEEEPIHVLVHNAGYADDAPLAGMTREQWTGVLDVILNGFFNVTRPLLMPMIRARFGRIVNVASIAALAGNRGQANYAAAKAGVIAAAKSLAQEVARKGITVNNVAPGVIDTPMARRAFDDERVRVLVPMQRFGTPSEVAALVSFLVSDAASYISGQTISVDGAMY
jgi:3-oxoacyl-[acyl-carrier protein] reductase